jgi:protein-S-isoprenylcysteine O-methyltransferase Ste14
MIPALDHPIVDIAGHHLIAARFLQDVSSLIGLFLVLAAVAYGLRSGPRAEVPERRLGAAERRAWTAAYVTAAIAITGLFLVIRHPHYGVGRSLALVIGNYAIAALRGFAAALVAVSLALLLRLRTGR